jgi:hypothetical protein
MAFQIYTHPATSPPLQSVLQKALPYCINLVYRTKHPNRTEHANILATFPPDCAEIPKCWAAAYLDRSMRPETELWIFSTGELPDHSPSDQFCPDCKQAVLALVNFMGTLPVPPMRQDNLPALDLAKQHEKEHPESGPNACYPLSTGTYMRHLLIPSVVTLGACHQQVLKILSEAGLLREEFPGPKDVLNKFLFKVSNLPQTKELPDGLTWGDMREQDMEIVQSRTSIPRTKRTLLSLKSVGVFEKSTDEPVAWTFLGLDGSLTTLHTEPEYRGQGIAKAVAARIMREHAPAIARDEDGTVWVHADVYFGNVQSEAVCSSLGGEALWKIFWVRIDIGRERKPVDDA